MFSSNDDHFDVSHGWNHGNISEHHMEKRSRHKTCVRCKLGLLKCCEPNVCVKHTLGTDKLHFNHGSKTNYVGLSRWLEALENALKAVEQLKKSLQADVNTPACFVHHVGYIYHEQKQYQEALELYYTHLSEDDPSVFVVYHRTARVYYQLDMYTEALVLYQKTFNIALKTLPDNAKQITTIYMDLFSVYLGLKQYDESLIAAVQVIEQLRETLPNNHPEVVQYRVHLDVVKHTQISETGLSIVFSSGGG